MRVENNPFNELNDKGELTMKITTLEQMIQEIEEKKAVRERLMMDAYRFMHNASNKYQTETFYKRFLEQQAMRDACQELLNATVDDPEDWL